MGGRAGRATGRPTRYMYRRATRQARDRSARRNSGVANSNWLGSDGNAPGAGDRAPAPAPRPNDALTVAALVLHQ